MFVTVLVRVKVDPAENDTISHSRLIVAESVRMAIQDAVTEQEANGFVHPLHNDVSLHVTDVELSKNA